MSTIQAKSTHSKKQLHESVLEKLHHAVSDFGHMVHEIKFKRLIAKAARIISDGLHGGKTEAKKVVKKKVAPKKIKAPVDGAKKALKKAAHTAPKNVAKKVVTKK